MSKRTRHLLARLATASMVVLAWSAPAWSQDPAADEVPTAEAQSAELPAGRAAGGAPTRTQFRLFANRPITLRLGPNAGYLLPELVPVFSPQTPDFFAAEPTPGPQLALAVSVALLSVDGARDSGKGQEFRDLDDGIAVGLDAQRRGERSWFRLVGRHLGLNDQDARLELRHFGHFKARLSYSQIPHNYVFDAPSLYQGIDTGRLTIDDQVQTFLQGAVSDTDAAERASFVLANASRADLRHRRDRTGIEIDWTHFDPLAIQLSYKTEARQGSRPWSASFGLGSFVEIPWAVDYRSEELRLGIEWAQPGFLVRAGLRRATFENGISSVQFDNPWRVVDGTGFNTIVTSYQNGPASGLIDLYPDNEQEELTFTAIKRQLPGNTTVSATASYGRLDQDDPLVPYTVNTAIVPGVQGSPPFDASDPANRPADRAGARLDTRLVHLRLTSKPLPFLKINAYYRDYQRDNESDQIQVPGFVNEDGAWRPARSDTGYLVNLPIDYASSTLGVEFGFLLEHNTKLTLGYKREEIDRSFREVANSEEETFKISIDSKPRPWVELRASLLSAQRDIGEYVFDQFFVNQGGTSVSALPLLRKFDQAARDRDRLQLLALFYPTETLTVSGSVIRGEDDYPESAFGVLDNEHTLYNVDLAYAASDRWSFYAAYTVEDYEMRMRGREWFPTAPSDPFLNETGFDSNSNWLARTEDQTTTVAAALDLHLIPDRLSFQFSISHTETDGAIRLDSPVGTPADDLNPFTLVDFEQVDDVAWLSLNPELTYTVREDLTLVAGYHHEDYDIDDFTLQGLQLVPTTPDGAFNGGLLMDTIFRDFDLDVWYLKVEMEW